MADAHPNISDLIIDCADPERLAEAGWELGGSNMRLLTPDPESVETATGQK